MQQDHTTRIEQLRLQLAALLEARTSLSDPQVVQLSSELDKLVIDEMKRKNRLAEQANFNG